MTLTRSTSTLAGPAPTSPPVSGPQNVRVVPGWSPLVQNLAWDPVPGISGYNVFIKMSAAVSQWTLANTAPLGSESFADANFRQPGTMYRVTALYSDGREGSTDFVYADPPRLEVPTQFSVRLLSPGVVRLSWSPVKVWGLSCGTVGCTPIVIRYLPTRVMGPGQPADGTLVPWKPFWSVVDDQVFDISNLPDGTYAWQVTADYGGIYETGGLPTASITLKPPPPPVPAARFRVSILGFKAIVETDDDLLSRDGKNNEVYAAATGSATGGITSGNSVGVGPSGTTAGSTFTFPYLLWEGMLSPVREAIWIAPSLWESGGVADQLLWFDSSHQSQLNSGYSNSGTPGISREATSVLGGGFVP